MVENLVVPDADFRNVRKGDEAFAHVSIESQKPKV